MSGNESGLTSSEKHLDRDHAKILDDQDSLRQLRNEFIIPSKNDLRRRTLANSANSSTKNSEPCIYLCGNSLGLQPFRLREQVNDHLSAWAIKGVAGHFAHHEDSSLPPFFDVDDVTAEKMAPLVGALKSEVALMETLTANLHLLMASFYCPSKEKYKIMLEGKAFPSDHYAIESQIRHHKLNPVDAMVIIESDNPASPILKTSHIISMINEHASSLALILLPGIQYYTGQYLDIERITAYAHSHDIIIGWDLAHAAGNVVLELHEWGVDFAAWCNYKYLNSGPGAIAGLFVHSKHGIVDENAIENGKEGFRPRLCGWWGGKKSTRFNMRNTWFANHEPANSLDPAFIPIPGAGGFQVGNPSALALTALLASLEVFSLTSMSALRTKSIALTKYLQDLLLQPSSSIGNDHISQLYEIITPSNPAERGAQLSVRLKPGLLEGVMELLEEAGVVVDARKPDVVRVAPAPLYNTYTEIWDFVYILKDACEKVKARQIKNTQDSMILQNEYKKQ